jgi:tRNA modification GTPase
VDELETIAAIATAPGRGAIAIVRVSGPDARAVGERVFRAERPLEARVATRGRVVASDGATLDDALALYFPAPHSYTGQDVLELHVHGSPAVAREVLSAMLAAGARMAGPGEFTRRAFLAGKLDLSAAEAVADLIAAEHAGAARAAAARLSGGLAREVERIRATLAAMLEELAAAIDFPDEVESPSGSELVSRLAPLRAELAELATSWERGRLVREGVAIAIVGPPNAGKSSLLNALLGADRALVAATPGTTRDTIEESLALDGLVARAIDTAGLRASDDAVERAGIARSERALAEATVALVVVDGSRPLSSEARDLLARTRGRERVVYFNKRDLGAQGYAEREDAERDALFGSIFERASVEEVRTALRARAADGEVPDTARPHLGTARQADAVLAALRSLEPAAATLAAGAPVDLAAGDLAAAYAALGELTGSAASEAVLDAIFARFCIGK